MSAIDVGELLCSVELEPTSIAEFGVSFTDFIAGLVALPLEGTRFDAAFVGAA